MISRVLSGRCLKSAQTQFWCCQVRGWGEYRTALGDLALKSGLPTMFGSREDLAVGCLMAYGAGRFDLIRRAAGYVDKILKGTKPSDLPVQQPTKFELVVNLASAKALGITIPPSLLAQADEVIE